MNTISFSGIASGLDTQALISALVQAEGRPIDFLRNQRASAQSQLGAYGDLVDKLKALETSLKDFEKVEDFLSFDQNLSNEGFLSVSSTGSASPAQYDIAIEQLATSAFLRTDGYADPNAGQFGGGTGSFILKYGGDTFSVDLPSNASLNDVKDAFNNSGADVNASVIFDGTDYHLEVRGGDTGKDNTISFQLPLGSPTLPTFSTNDAPEDARFTVDGFDYTSTDNIVENAIPGLTLTLIAAHDFKGTATPTVPTDDNTLVTVTENLQDIEQRVRDLLTSYNDVINLINKQGKFDPQDENATAPPLFGDSTLRSLSTKLGSAAVNQVLLSGPNSTFDSLGSIGITTQLDGTLSLDSTDFQDALTTDQQSVRDVFADPTTGVIASLLQIVDTYAASSDGLIDARQDGLKTQIRGLDDQIRRGEERLERFEQTQIRKFAAFETLIGQLQSQGNALSGFASIR